MGINCNDHICEYIFHHPPFKLKVHPQTMAFGRNGAIKECMMGGYDIFGDAFWLTLAARFYCIPSSPTFQDPLRYLTTFCIPPLSFFKPIWYMPWWFCISYFSSPLFQPPRKSFLNCLPQNFPLQKVLPILISLNTNITNNSCSYRW